MNDFIYVLAGPGGGSAGGGFPGGSTVPAVPSGGDDILDFIMYCLNAIVSAFSSITDFFSWTFSDVTDWVIENLPFLNDQVSEIVNKIWNTITIFGLPLGHVPIILVMIGGALNVYVFVQLLLWVLSIFRG